MSGCRLKGSSVQYPNASALPINFPRAKVRQESNIHESQKEVHAVPLDIAVHCRSLLLIGMDVHASVHLSVGVRARTQASVVKLLGTLVFDVLRV